MYQGGACAIRGPHALARLQYTEDHVSTWRATVADSVSVDRHRADGPDASMGGWPHRFHPPSSLVIQRNGPIVRGELFLWILPVPGDSNGRMMCTVCRHPSHRYVLTPFDTGTPRTAQTSTTYHPAQTSRGLRHDHASDHGNRATYRAIAGTAVCKSCGALKVIVRM